MGFILDNFVWILCALCALFLICSLIKKAAKLAIIFVVLAVLFSSGGIALEKVKDNYNIDVDGSKLVCTIQGQTWELDSSEVTNITESEASDSNNIHINIGLEDGSSFGFDINKYLWGTMVKGKVEKAGIEIIETQQE